MNLFTYPRAVLPLTIQKNEIVLFTRDKLFENRLGFIRKYILFNFVFLFIFSFLCRCNMVKYTIEGAYYEKKILKEILEKFIFT